MVGLPTHNENNWRRPPDPDFPIFQNLRFLGHPPYANCFLCGWAAHPQRKIWRYLVIKIFVGGIPKSLRLPLTEVLGALHLGDDVLWPQLPMFKPEPEPDLSCSTRDSWRNSSFFISCWWKVKCTLVKVYLPLCHTTLNGTDGQRTARTTSCGPPSAAIGITSMSGTRECHNNGASSSRGRVSVASCVKYKLALLVSSVPPSKDLKMSASFSHSALADATTGRKGIIPVLVLVNALLYLGCCFQRTKCGEDSPHNTSKAQTSMDKLLKHQTSILLQPRALVSPGWHRAMVFVEGALS